MTRHRARPRRGRSLALLAIVLSPLLAVLFLWGSEKALEPAEVPVPASVSAAGVGRPMAEPTRRAPPRFLTRSYRAPPSLVHRGGGGRLLIPPLGIEAPVDAVGLDGTAMAVPDDPARVGWLVGTARSSDVVGSSVLAGHVSDRRDRPGALARLGSVRVGQLVTWVDEQGIRHRFHVIRVQRFTRSKGLPASMFATDGPRALHLVTCADRVTTEGGGFHYRSNLVVTAIR